MPTWSQRAGNKCWAAVSVQRWNWHIQVNYRNLVAQKLGLSLVSVKNTAAEFCWQSYLSSSENGRKFRNSWGRRNGTVQPWILCQTFRATVHTSKRLCYNAGWDAEIRSLVTVQMGIEHLGGHFQKGITHSGSFENGTEDSWMIKPFLNVTPWHFSVESHPEQCAVSMLMQVPIAILLPKAWLWKEQDSAR